MSTSPTPAFDTCHLKRQTAPALRHVALGVALLLGCSAPKPAPKSTPPASKGSGSAAASPAGKPGAADASKRGAAPIAKAAPDPVPAACAATDKAIRAAYEPYLDAFSNRGIALSPDGKLVLFSSNRGGGAPQLYLGKVRRPADPPLALAKAKDRAGGARFLPDGKHVVFTRDKDNNENWQIYLASVDGKTVRALTERPGHFHQAPHVTRDGKSLVYFRGKRRSPVYELVVHDIATGKVRSVYKAKGFHGVTDVDRAGKRALVTEFSSPSRSRTLLIDLGSGNARDVYPGKGHRRVPAHAHSARFDSAGRSAYVVSDLGSSRTTLRRISLSGAKVLASYASANAEVHSPVVDPTGRLVAVLLHHGNHTEVVLLDAKSLARRRARRRRRRARERAGLYYPTRFGPKGRKLVVTVSRPSAPSDAFALDTRRGRLRLLRDDPRPGLRKLARLRVELRRVPTFDKLAVPLNIYLPQRRGAGKLPVLVKVHGGPASTSIVRWSPFNAFFVSRGWAVVEPNVRGSSGFGKAFERADNGRKRMDSVKDLGAVNAWVRKQPWADSKRIVVFGGSYGGYMTYMALGHQADRWAAGVGLVGVVNLRTFLRNTSGAIRHVFREEFGTLKKDGGFLDSVSPIRVVDRFKAPLLVYQGATDPRVPRSEQDQLVRRLRARKHPVEYLVAMDEGHSLNHRHNKLEMVGRMHRFLDAHLRRAGVAPACAKALGVK